MDIEPIPEAEEENEAERSDYNSSNIDLAFNRVDTEYCDDNSSYHIVSIEEIFTNYQKFSAVLVLSLLFLALSLYHLANQMLPFAPLAIFQLFFLYKNFSKYKEEFPILSKFWKSEFFLKAFENLCNFSSLVFIALFVIGKINLVFWAATPIVCAVIGRLIIKINFENNCTTFASIVHGVFMWSQMFVLIELGLKLDLRLGVSWTIVLMPVFIICGISLLIFIISVSLALINLCSKEKDISYLYSHFWLQYTVLCGSLTFLALFYNFSKNNPRWLFLPILYLTFFIILTKALKKTISTTWSEFFTSENFAEPQIADESPLPIPCSQKNFIETSFKDKITNAIKMTPKVLVKFAKPQIKQNLNRMKICKTLSQSHDVNNITKIHVRSRSSCITGYNFESVLSSCKFCYRNSAVNKFQDCGHGELCNTCAEMYVRAKKKCYVCQEPITGILQDNTKTVGTENSNRKAEEV